MKKTFASMAAAAIAATGFGLVGCDETDMTRSDGVEVDRAEVRDDTRDATDRLGDAASNAGERMETAAEQTAEAIRDGADAVGDATADAVDSAQTAADRAEDNVDAAVDADADANLDTNAAADRDGTLAPDGTAAAPDAEGIRDILASSTEASLTKGGFDDLVERFVDADRNRIGDFAEQDMTELDGLIAEIQEQWKAKYDQDFDIGNEELVFNEQFRIQQGEIGDGARLAADADVDVDADAGTADADMDVDAGGVDAPGSADADKNLNDPGRNTATVTVPASHGLPELTLNLIHEMPDNWRIDIPDSVDGAKLQQNLKDHLTQVKDSAAMWPADVNEAYRLVSHHVFMALNDQPATPAGGGM